MFLHLGSHPWPLRLCIQLLIWDILINLEICKLSLSCSTNLLLFSYVHTYIYTYICVWVWVLSIYSIRIPILYLNEPEVPECHLDQYFPSEFQQNKILVYVIQKCYNKIKLYTDRLNKNKQVFSGKLVIRGLTILIYTFDTVSSKLCEIQLPLSIQFCRCNIWSWVYFPFIFNLLSNFYREISPCSIIWVLSLISKLLKWPLVPC